MVPVWQGDRKVTVLYAKRVDTRYRLYFYDPNGRLIFLPSSLPPTATTGVIAEANKRVGNMGAELWAGDRIIRNFLPKDLGEVLLHFVRSLVDRARRASVSKLLFLQSSRSR